jgi:hypothetical protein
MKTKKNISKRQLQKYLDELIAIAQNLTSEVETVVQIPGVEGQHAWLEIYVPEKLEEQISDLVSERVLDIFMETGYDIGAIVHEKDQPQRMAAETNEQEDEDREKATATIS